MSYPPEWRLALRNGGSNTLRPVGLPAAPARIGSHHTDCLVSDGNRLAQDFGIVGRGWSLARNARGGSGIAAALEGTRPRLREASSITA